MHPNDTVLNDYVDGSLSPAERAEINRHLATCAACRQTVDDVREILHATRELELREPPVRVWSRLERGIRMERDLAAVPGARGVQADRGEADGARRKRLPFVTSPWTAWLAAAAVLLLATTIGVRYMPARHTDTPAATSASANPGDAAQSVETELRQAEAHYENAIKGLEVIANSEQSELDPGTAATLQKNLAVIDQAISESRAAVRAQPASEPAQQSLIDGFKTKIGLLQDTVALINEMRKGNEVGAARIASGLKEKGT
ncbi:MAG: zf-HC2 domain-containing protein [Vicinamibacterales bacterium]